MSSNSTTMQSLSHVKFRMAVVLLGISVTYKSWLHETPSTKLFLQQNLTSDTSPTKTNLLTSFYQQVISPVSLDFCSSHGPRFWCFCFSNCLCAHVVPERIQAAFGLGAKHSVHVYFSWI